MSDIIGKIDLDIEWALREIKEAEKLYKYIRKWIVGEVIKISAKAANNNVSTLASDLDQFLGHLTNLMKKFQDPKIGQDLASLAEKIKLFIDEYKKAGLSGVFEDSGKKLNIIERLESFDISILKVLQNTILKDLRGKEQDLERIYKDLSRDTL